MKVVLVNLTAEQKQQVEALDPADESDFAVIGQVFVGNHPKAGKIYCYQFNRAQYDIMARALKRAFKLGA